MPGAPYKPEGLLPMDAFKNDPNHPGVGMPILPQNATEEERRIYEMNMRNYQQFNQQGGMMAPPGVENQQYPPQGEMMQGTQYQQYQNQQNYQQMPPPNGGMYGPPQGGDSAPPLPPQSGLRPVNLVAAAATIFWTLFKF
jgi:hypothetical protein